MRTTTEQVRHVIAEQVGVHVDAVLPETRIVEDLGADSLDAIELVMAIEDNFDLELDDDDAAKCCTVADCIALVERMLPTPACARVG